MPTATCPIPAHESSHVREGVLERSYEHMEHPAKPTAARRSWPRTHLRALRVMGFPRSEAQRAGLEDTE